MLKKLFLWSLYAAFVGILVAGAAYRTSVKLATGNQERSRGSASNSQPNHQAEIPLTEEVPFQEHIEISGQVLEASHRGLTIQLANGQSISLSGRAWRYAQNLGFTAQTGDRVSIKGIFENNRFEIIQMTLLRTEQAVNLRDENGQPLWRNK